MIRSAVAANLRAARLTVRWLWAELRTRQGKAFALSTLIVAIGLSGAWDIATHEMSPPRVSLADHAGVVLIVGVLGALVVGMVIETEEWRPATYGFLGMFTGFWLLYGRTWMGIRGDPLLQSNEAIWACRILIIVSAAYLLGIVCYRLMTRHIDWRRAGLRLALLVVLLALLFAALWLINGGMP